MKPDQKSSQPRNAAGIIPALACFTCFYGASFLGYFGGSQGMWFWYIVQRRPAWAIPSWSFTLVWTILYGVLAFATWNVWISESNPARSFGLILMSLEVAMLVAWPWQFFAWHQPIASWVVAAIAAATSIATCITFWLVKPKAGVMVLITLPWFIYAGLLDAAIWVLNR